MLYVRDGTVITSAGTAAGIDAALHLVRLELGSRRRHDDRPPHGRAAPPRRRAAPVHRPPGAHDDRREPRPGAGVDARAPRRARDRRRPRPAGRHVPAHLRPALRRRDGHDAAPVDHRPARAAGPSGSSRTPTCPSRPSPATPGSAPRRCCGTTSRAAPASRPPPSAPSTASRPDVRRPAPGRGAGLRSARGCRAHLTSGRSGRGTSPSRTRCPSRPRRRPACRRGP